MEVEVGDLRPEAAFVTKDEEAVLAILARHRNRSKALAGHGPWLQRGFKAECVIEVTESRDLTEPVRYLLGLESPSDDQE